MKTVRIENYIQGLASFLDENDIRWEHCEILKDSIIIYYDNHEHLFRIGFEFGKFYESIDN